MKKILKKYYWRLKDIFLHKYLIFFYRSYQYKKNYFFNSDIQNNIHKFVNKNSKNHILEIGTYEGLASIWFSKKYLKNSASTLTIVDPFFLEDKTTAILEDTQINFQKNYNIFRSSQTKYYKLTSDEFFKNNKELYNFIYIDGSHELEDIKNDLINSDKCLEKNGIIWCDDYSKTSLDCFIPINEFFEDNKDRYRLLFKSYQIAYKKVE